MPASTFYQNPEKQHTQWAMGVFLAAIFAMLWLIIHLGVLWWEYSQQTRIWEIIPADAVAVVELEETDTWVNTLDSLPFFRQTQQVSSVEFWKDKCNRIDSLLTIQPSFALAWHQKKSFASLHLNSSESFGWIFYLPLPQADTLRPPLLQALLHPHDIEVQTRIYHGHQIFEKKEVGKVPTLSAAYLKDYLIVSRYGQLIEDVLRKSASEQIAPPLEALRRKRNRWQPSKSQKNTIFLNIEQVSRWLGAFSGKLEQPLLPGLEHFSSGLVGTVADTDSGLHLQATYLPRTLMEHFRQVKPDTARGYGALPNNTQLFIQATFLDGNQFQESLDDFWNETKPEHWEISRQTVGDWGFPKDDFWEKISGEMIWAKLASKRQQRDFFELALFKTQHPDQLNELLQNWIETLDLEQPSEITTFKEVSIFRLPVDGFLHHLVGIGKQNAPSYFALQGKHLLVGNQRQALVEYLSHREQGQTLEQRRFFAQYEKQFKAQTPVFTLGVHLPAAWQYLYKQATPSWKKFLDQHQRMLLRHEFLSINWQANKKERVDLFLSHNQIPPTRPDTLALANEISFATAPAIQLTQVRNHLNGAVEIIFQDKWHRLHLLAENGEKIWRVPLGRPITTPIQQIDFYGNGRLQYLFGAGNRLYLIDRNGKYVRNFPLPLPAFVMAKYIVPLPYNRGKNFRFLATDEEGNAFMISQYGTLQKGWQPRTFPDRLAASPQHINIQGRDLVLFLLQDGSLHAVGLRARPVGEFPLLFTLGTKNPMFLEKGSRAEDTHISFLGDNGELVQTNLVGEVLNRMQLPRRFPGSGFQLCIDETSGNGWVAARQEGNETAIISSQGKVLFRQPFDHQEKRTVQFFRFAEHVAIISMLDHQSKKLHLFFQNGDPVAGTPIDCDMPVTMRYTEESNRFELYAPLGKGIKVLRFRNW